MLIATMALCLLGCPAIGQESDVSLDYLLTLSLEQLGDYPVTAPTKSAVAISQTPGAVSVITYDQIRRSGAQTIPDLLRSVPGVNVRWNPMVQTIDIRSFGSNPFTNRVLLLIDGVPYNSWNKGGFPQHPGFDFFNLQNVKHLEIIRGPGSALYGENALNGVINIVTLSAREALNTRARVAVGARDTESLSVTHGAVLGEKASLLLSARRQQGRLPLDVWRNTGGAESTDLFIKAQLGNFQASWYRLDDEFAGYVNELDNGGVFRSANSIEQTVDIAALNYKHQSADGRWSASGNLSYAKRDGSHCAACHSPSNNQNFRRPTDHGNQLFANGQVNVQLNDYNEVMFGAEFRELDSGDHDEELLGSDLVADQHGGHGGHGDASVLNYKKHAFFVQNALSLDGSRFKLIAGLRYDGATSPDLFDSELFPRLSMVYQPLENLTLRAGWSESARYPSFSELYQASPFLNLEIGSQVIELARFEANPELRPEYVQAMEFGVEYWPSPTLQLRADLYQNQIDDHIQIAYPRFRWENHPAQAVVNGGELELRHTRGEFWEFYGNWSYQNNRQRGAGVNSVGDGIDFSYSPGRKMNLGAVYRPNPHLTTFVDLRWKDEYTAPDFWYPIAFPDNPIPEPLPSYGLLDVKIKWQPPLLTRDGQRPIEVSIAARNLLDKTPFETLSGFGGRLNGRELHLTFEYRFGL